MSDSKVIVYLALSLDGYIAGPDHDLNWLSDDYSTGGLTQLGEGVLGFEELLDSVGCIVMGRNTYDVIASFKQWPYGNVPVLVATRTPFQTQIESIRAVAGTIEDIIRTAKRRANGKRIYIDGANVVQQAADAGLIDEWVLSMVPIMLGSGTRLFENIHERQKLAFTSHETMANGIVQLHAKPA